MGTTNPSTQTQPGVALEEGEAERSSFQPLPIQRSRSSSFAIVVVSGRRPSCYEYYLYSSEDRMTEYIHVHKEENIQRTLKKYKNIFPFLEYLLFFECLDETMNKSRQKLGNDRQGQ
jgi:hypothetical protein